MDAERRIVDYLNDDCSEEETRELMEWVREDSSNAKLFATLSMLHGQLRSQLAGQQNARESGLFDSDELIDAIDSAKSGTSNSELKVEKQKAFLSRYQISALGILAASVLIVLGFWFFPRSDENPEDAALAFGTVKQVSDAVWRDSSIGMDDRIGSQTLDLVSGIALIQFDSGVEVTLEGPATYKIKSVKQTQLQSGVLVANVPPGAEGFKVETPVATVVDLGTSFGVKVEDDHSAEVLVFDGEVEIQSDNESSSRRVSEGESLRLAANGRAEPVAFNTRRFERLWRLSSGVSSTTGSCQFVPPWPRNVVTLPTGNEVFLIPENFSIRLGQSLNVNISEAGKYTNEEQLTPGSILQGERVRSYLFYYFPDESVGRRRAKTVKGSATFEMPIEGVVVLRNELVASSRLGRLRAGEVQPRRQLEFDSVGGDKVVLSDDRRTLEFELSAPGRSADLIRVIVGSNDEPARLRAKGKRKKKRKGKSF